MLLTSQHCWAYFGDPMKEKNMTVWHVPGDLHKGAIPAKIYCNQVLIIPLEKAFRNLISRGHLDELKTWDGCFCIRKKVANSSMSLHSWGLAVDLNAATNRYGQKPSFLAEFVKCFTDAGFDWGGAWHTPDGMHFQLHSLPGKE